MDFQRDYILRIIQMMGDLMRRIAELMDDLRRMRLLDDACRRFCGMTLATADTLSAESLCELLAPMARFWMSELLYARATATDEGRAEPKERLLKSLHLLVSLHAEPNLCTLREERVIELKRAVYPQWDAALLMDCARFFAQAERYDEMEDALFQALEMGSADDRTEAVAMLRSASKATPAALARCRMTGQELRLSARELDFNEQESRP